MDGLVVRDTHKLVGKLQQRGFSAQQAEGIADALKELDLTGVATKGDLQALREDLHQLKFDLIKWMVGTQLAYGAIIVGVLVIL